MREREETVGAAHPCRARAARRCPGTAGTVTSSAGRDLAQEHPRARRSAGTERKLPSPQHGSSTLLCHGRAGDTSKPTYTKHTKVHASCSHPHVHIHTFLHRALVFTLEFLPVCLHLLGVFGHHKPRPVPQNTGQCHSTPVHVTAHRSMSQNTSPCHSTPVRVTAHRSVPQDASTRGCAAPVSAAHVHAHTYISGRHMLSTHTHINHSSLSVSPSLFSKLCLKP